MGQVQKQASYWIFASGKLAPKNQYQNAEKQKRNSSSSSSRSSSSSSSIQKYLYIYPKRTGVSKQICTLPKPNIAPENLPFPKGK